jgi:TonB family protein
MKFNLLLLLLLVTDSLVHAGGQTIDTTNSGSSPVLQVLALTGDRVSGFTRSCLLVRRDGKYHRETIRQEHENNRFSRGGDWESPEVFEASLSAAELEQLNVIVGSENFRSIRGTVGSLVNLPSRIAFAVNGVVPLDFVEVFEASVAHSSGPQYFQILEMPTEKPAANSVKLLKRWVAEIGKRKDGLQRNALVTSCSISPTNGDTIGLTATELIPRPIFTPAPEYPVEEKNAKHTGTVSVSVLINSDGSVGSVSVRHGINAVLDRCAADAVKQWKFAPALLVGIAVPMSMNLDVPFRL